MKALLAEIGNKLVAKLENGERISADTTMELALALFKAGVSSAEVEIQHPTFPQLAQVHRTLMRLEHQDSLDIPAPAPAPRAAIGILIADFAIYLLNQIQNNKSLDNPFWSLLDVGFVMGQIDEMLEQASLPYDRLKQHCYKLYCLADVAGVNPKENLESYFDLLEIIGADERGGQLPVDTLSSVSLSVISSANCVLRYEPHVLKKAIYPKRR